MARIRTIKPEFWTDAIIVQLPFHARLLYIGLWNFCDDDGRFPDEPDRLKMQIFPSDEVDIAGLLDLLEATGRVELCEGKPGERYWTISKFKEHQRIDHPSKSKFREPSRKRAIPQSARREVAKKYGCPPGEEKDAECFYCGLPGKIYWWRRHGGQPSSWVSFSLELDHVAPEATGGDATGSNLVLACRACNRSKGFADVGEWLAKRLPALPREPSRALAPEGKGMEGNGIDGRSPASPAEAAPPPKEPRARKPSAQQDFAVSFEERRKAVLGPAWTEDKTLGAARLNAELDWVKTADRTETADAVTAYLEDPRRRAQDPPCSLLWFSRDRAEYVSKARRQLGLLEPPDTRPPCANCGEVVTTVDIRGRRLCYPCAAAAQLSGAA